jgi:hypothetical protein
MSNVVSFRIAQSRVPIPPRLPRTSDTELASRVAELHSGAKEEIYRSILMLDLAAQHARQIAKRVCDPEMKENFDAQIATIEQLLQLARDMALEL